MSTLGGYTIYIVKDNGAAPVSVAVQEVLDDTKSRLHYFNTPSKQKRITCYIFGAANYNNVIGLRGSSSVNLTDDQGSQGNWFIMNISDDRGKGTPVNFDAVSTSDPFWVATIDLLKDDS